MVSGLLIGKHAMIFASPVAPSNVEQRDAMV